MNKVLIQITTEFHYMVALSLIEKFYSGPDFEIHFMVYERTGHPCRLDSIELDAAYTYHRVSYDHHHKKVFQDVLDIKEFIFKNQFHSFISFLYHDPLFVFLTYYFKSKGTTTYLAPDGMGAYVKFKAKNLRSKLMNTLASYKFFSLHGLKFPKIWFTSWDFGFNGYYDYIYAYSKTLPYVPKSKKIIEVDYQLSPEKVEKLKKSFGISLEGIPTENVVLLINERHKVVNYEKQLLDIIGQQRPDAPILFKKHPNADLQNLKFLSDYKNVIFLEEVFPVEILIASLKNSVIISSYSTSMLYHNPTCKYFWTYPIVEKGGELNKPIERFNPKGYITVLNSFEELKNSI